jgi:hypothetical protein
MGNNWNKHFSGFYKLLLYQRCIVSNLSYCSFHHVIINFCISFGVLAFRLHCMDAIRLIVISSFYLSYFITRILIQSAEIIFIA